MTTDDLNPIVGKPDDAHVGGHRCPHCGRVNDHVSHAGTVGDGPRGRQLSICWACRGIGVFRRTAFGLVVEALSPAAERAILARPDVQAVLATLSRHGSPVQAARDARGRLS